MELSCNDDSVVRPFGRAGNDDAVEARNNDTRYTHRVVEGTSFCGGRFTFSVINSACDDDAGVCDPGSEC